jgi:hypothetical protein
MSKDIEKNVLEETKLNHSEIPSLTGNLVKVEKQDDKIVSDERDVNKRISTVLMVVLSLAGVWLFVYIIIALVRIHNPIMH